MIKPMIKTMKAYLEHQMRNSKEKMKDEVYFDNMSYLDDFVDHDNEKLEDILLAHYKTHNDVRTNLVYIIRDNDDYDMVDTILVAKTMYIYVPTNDYMLIYKVFYNIYKHEDNRVHLEIGIKNTEDGVLDIERFHSILDSFHVWDDILGLIISDIMDNHLYKIDIITASRITDILTGHNTNVFDRRRMRDSIAEHLEKYKNTNKVEIFI